MMRGVRGWRWRVRCIGLVVGGVCWVVGPVAVAVGAGDGSGAPGVAFADGVGYAVGQVPVGVTVADVDGDGVLDVLAANSSSNSVTIRRGLGDGSLAPAAVTVALSGGSARAVVADDIDGDGDVDLVVGMRDSSGLLAVVEATGPMRFAAPPRYDGGAGGVFNLAMADLDGDGDRDAAVAQAFGGNAFVTVLRNDDGVFVPSGDYVFGPSQVFYVVDVAAGDLNGDGAPDLAAIGLNTGNWSVILNANDGSGTFLAPAPLSVGQTLPQAVAIADMNGDGHLDLVVAEGETLHGDAGVRVSLNDGSGGFSTSAHTPVPSVGSSLTTPAGLTVADLDNDGDTDVAVTSHQPPFVAILQNDGAGGLAHVMNLATQLKTLDVAAGDLDGDGRTDLVSVDALLAGPGTALVHINSTSFAPVDGDVDGDGVVGVDDLVAVIIAWGPCNGCPEDLDGSGVVDVDDLVAVILGWT